MLFAILPGLALAVFLFQGGSREPVIHGRAVVEMADLETHLFPVVRRDEPGAISNFLSQVGSRALLASVSKASEKSFALERVGRIRGYPLFHIDYCGRDPVVVEAVASNAAVLVIGFYATNQPDWQATLHSTASFILETPPDRLRAHARGYWRRFKAGLTF